VKIARFSHNGHVRLGVVDGDQIADLGGNREIPTDVGTLLSAGADEGIAAVRAAAVDAQAGT
jgi:hypothetical protein